MTNNFRRRQIQLLFTEEVNEKGTTGRAIIPNFQVFSQRKSGNHLHTKIFHAKFSNMM